MTSAPTEPRYTSDRDISSQGFWAKPFPERDETFAWLRANAPVSYHRPLEHVGAFGDLSERPPGFWAVTLAADINYVSQHHELFFIPVMLSRAEGADENRNLLAMNPPEHTKHRNIISEAFTPKGVHRIEGKIEERAEAIVAEAVDAGEFDFVERVSSRLPMLTVADIIGVPESQIEAFAKTGSDAMNALSSADEFPEGVDPMQVLMEANAARAEMALDLVAFRREHPADDVATALALAEIDGRPLSDGQIVAAVGLLVAAGNDTTKHATSWTTYQFCRNPDQRAWLLEDYEGRIGQSVDEFIRHASVVITFPRIVVADMEWGGQPLREGDTVQMFYCSGNRDESLFPDPNRFDLARPRANHVAFGGRGAHYCLGNVVARAQLRALFRHILTKLPNLELTQEPKFLHSVMINGISKMPVRT